MMQVWQTRYPTTEVLAQVLFLGAAFGLVVSMQTRVAPLALASGFLVTAGFLNRGEGVLMVMLALLGPTVCGAAPAEPALFPIRSGDLHGQGNALSALAAGHADLIAFGRPYLANPDLVERFAAHAPLNPLDIKTLYGGDAHGYTDYPALEAAAA